MTVHTVIRGIPISPGVAFGRAMRIAKSALEPAMETLADAEIAPEKERYAAALEETRRQLRELQNEVRARLDDRNAGIFEAHLMLVDDHTFQTEVMNFIDRDHFTADYAVFQAAEKCAAALQAIPDEYLSERAADLRDVASRILGNLSELQRGDLTIDARRIIVAPQLTPAETIRLDRKKVLGFVTETASATSHTAILARSLHLPAISGIPAEVIERLSAADMLIIDGFSGQLIINPEAREEETYKLKSESAGRLFDELEQDKSLRTETTDGFYVQLASNLDSLENLGDLQRYGSRGVGLFRTEFLFMNRTKLPDEEEQFEVYKKLLLANEELPVIIRTLDIGGDKFDKNVYRTTEANPFLGLRGIRLCLHERRDLFVTQLRALLRASVYGKLRIMFPMVSSVAELREVREIIAGIQEEFRQKGIEFSEKLLLGVMIETPAAALIADKFAPLVDFFSIGTNDLVQYTMAIDRDNEKVVYLYRPTHPAVLKLIRNTVRAAVDHSIFVSVCGQMASDPYVTPLLVGLGVHELSMVPSAIAIVRRVLRSISMQEAEEAAARAMACDTAMEAMKISSDLVLKCAPEIAEL